MSGYEQDGFDFEPWAVARGSDPSTSWDAARSVKNIRESQKQVLALFATHPLLTDEGLIRVADAQNVVQSDSGLRTRRKELVDLGLVRDSGLRDTTRSGRRTILWERVP